MQKHLYTILSHSIVAAGAYRLDLAADDPGFVPAGEFVDVSVPGFFLRRPLSICDCRPGRLTLVYKVVGQGTEALSDMPEGAEVEVLTGLGKGFDPEACHVTAVLGFNTDDDVLLVEEFRSVCDIVAVSTVDGSVGVKGFVTDAIVAIRPEFDFFYTCGPMVMMKVVCQSLEGPGEASLEERMGCGAGFCYGCSIQTKNGPRRVCKDGPVFKKEELIW